MDPFDKSYRELATHLGRRLFFGGTVLVFFFLGIPLKAALMEEAENKVESKTLSPASILVDGVKGEVTVTSGEMEDPSSSSLRNGMIIKQGSLVSTGQNSRADLVFTNGTVLALEAGTTLFVEQFLQAGGRDIDVQRIDGKQVIDAEVPRIGAIEKEPTYSSTRLFLREGTMYARVKKLHKKSDFTVGTPLGSSKILGTTWRQSLWDHPVDLTKSVKIQLEEGLIEFQPVGTKEKKNDPVFIRPQEEILISGKYKSLSDMNRVISLETVDVSIDLWINFQKTPIRDPLFPTWLAEYIPRENADQYQLHVPSDAGVGESPFDSGDWGAGDVGTAPWGGSNGGGAGGGEPLPEPPSPAS